MSTIVEKVLQDHTLVERFTEPRPRLVEFHAECSCGVPLGVPWYTRKEAHVIHQLEMVQEVTRAQIRATIMSLRRENEVLRSMFPPPDPRLEIIRAADLALKYAIEATEKETL